MNFREMRRGAQQLTEAECLGLLAKASSGVLALPGDGGYPYAVPLSYVYNDGKIYFHGAKRGHKFDAADGGCKASFCIITDDEIVPERFTTRYRSVIVFGTVRYLEEDADKRRALHLLCDKYCPDESREAVEAEIDKDFAAVCIAELTAEHITGKQGREFLRLPNE